MTRTATSSLGTLRLLEPKPSEQLAPVQPASPKEQGRLHLVLAAVALGCAAIAIAGAGYLFHRLQGTDTKLNRTHAQLTYLQQRVQDTRQSVRFVHDLVILCSYDRRLCLNGLGRPSVVVAGILRRAGLDPTRIPKTD